MEERKYSYTRGYYEAGSAARKANPEYEPQEVRSYRRKAQTVQQSATGIDVFPMILLVVTIAVTLYMCISYLKIRSDIWELDKAISAMGKQITAVSKENDAVEAVLDNELVDLEYIYEIAVGMLGMVYPNQNEVIYYEQEDKGYFSQYQDIPKS